jgi:hypothetical protein
MQSARQVFRAFFVAGLFCAAGRAHAAVPYTINYQGFLTEAATGKPQTAAVSVTFKLYDALTAGNLLYTEVQNVTPVNGTFNVRIGSVTAFPATLAFDKPYWLEITVGTQTLAPRQPLASSATALRAAVAESLPPVSGIGTLNFAAGVNTLTQNTTGSSNTGVGAFALRNNTTGDMNSGFGEQSLINNSTGSFNSAVGVGALAGNVAGNNNTAVGYATLAAQNLNFSDNTAIGYSALFGNSGSLNTAIGSRALFNNGTGLFNVAVGSNSLSGNVDGQGNIAIGADALKGASSGSYNIAIGTSAGTGLIGVETYNIHIGNPGVAGESGIVRIGDYIHSTTYLAGNVIINTSRGLYFGAQTRQMINLYGSLYGIGVQSNSTYFRSGQNFYWFVNGSHNDAQGNAGSGGTSIMALSANGLTVMGVNYASDRNAKENFSKVNSQDILRKVARLPVESWTFKQDGQHVRHIGPMAQDFAASFGVGPDDKHISAVDESGVALAAIKALYERLVLAEKQVQSKDKKIDKLESELAVIKTKLGLK